MSDISTNILQHHVMSDISTNQSGNHLQNLALMNIVFKDGVRQLSKSDVTLP